MAADTADSDGALPGRGPLRLKDRAAIAAVLAAMTLVVLDAGMTNVALPTLAISLGVSAADAVLVITAYQAALLMALLPCAALGERWGGAPVFRGGVAVFLIGALLCAFSPSLSWLVAARLVQGFGGAAIMALGVSLMRATVSSGRLGEAVGWNALTVALASAAAPTLGSLVIGHLHWPWLYAAAIPIGLLSLAASACLPAPASGLGRVDLTSVALHAAAFALIVVAAELALGSPALALVLVLSAATAFHLLVRRERPKTAPLLPLDLLSDERFRISILASVCCFIGQTAGMIALPFYLQHGLGQPAHMIGLFLLPWPLSVALAAAFVNRLPSFVPGAWVCAAGAGLLALGLAMTAAWPLTPDAPYPLIALTSICGLGFGLFQVPNNRNLFSAAKPERSGAAGGMQGTARITGQLIGALLVSILFTLVPLGFAPRLGLGVAAAFALAAAMASAARSTVRESQVAHAR